jgi:hypothetical protein
VPIISIFQDGNAQTVAFETEVSVAIRCVARNKNALR